MITPGNKILIVDDDEQITKLLHFFLDSNGYSCATASTGKEALEKMHVEEFDMVISDIKMPEMDGIVLTRELLKIRPDVCVMIMTGFTSEYTEEDALSTGACDFIRKPFTLAEFSVRLKRMVREKNRICDLQNLAFVDALTGLPNRKMFFDRANQALAHSKRYHHMFALLFLDADQFKAINDTHGHDAGDAVLKGMAGRLAECARNADSVARFAGDEFVVLSRLSKKGDAAVIGERILEILSQPFSFRERSISISASIGISLFPADGEDIDTLLKKADLAMYQAKKKGGNIYQFYEGDIDTTANASLQPAM